VKKRTCCGLRDELETVESGDLGGIAHGTTLGISVESRDRDDNILCLCLCCGLCGFCELVEHHGGDLLGGKGCWLAIVVDDDSNLSVSDLLDRVGEGPQFILDGRIIKPLSDDAFDVGDCVWKVSNDLFRINVCLSVPFLF